MFKGLPDWLNAVAPAKAQSRTAPAPAETARGEALAGQTARTPSQSALTSLWLEIAARRVEHSRGITSGTTGMVLPDSQRRPRGRSHWFDRR